MDHQINKSVGPELPQSAHPVVTPPKFQHSQKGKKEKANCQSYGRKGQDKLKLSFKKSFILSFWKSSEISVSKLQTWRCSRGLVLSQLQRQRVLSIQNTTRMLFVRLCLGNILVDVYFVFDLRTWAKQYRFLHVTE